jgi:phosphohistidine phosphatase SixA
VVLAFVRHGEPRRGETDPALTSWGRRTASEAARWLAEQGVSPTQIWHTPTRRTRETADEIHLVHPAATVAAVPDLPEGPDKWTAFVGDLQAAGGAVVAVGHHPTQDFLAANFGSAGVPLAPTHRGAVLLLVGPPWQCRACWPGRPS